jgi:hypothetical protein
MLDRSRRRTTDARPIARIADGEAEQEPTDAGKNPWECKEP